MTIYGESLDQFRPRPQRSALAAATSAMAIIASLLAVLTLSTIEVAIDWARGWRNAWVIYAPFADRYRIDPLFFSPAHHSFYEWAPLLTAALGFVLGLVIAYFWPTDQKLAIRLFVYSYGTMLVAFGILAAAFDGAGLAGVAARTGLPVPLGMAILIGISAIAVLRLEKNSNALLSNLFLMETPLQRAGIWALRIPLPYLVLAALCELNGYRVGAYALLVVMAMTLLENLSRELRPGYQRLERVRMREEAATLPIVALVCIGAAGYLFGSPLVGRDRRAVIVRGTAAKIETLAALKSSGPLHSSKLSKAPEKRKQRGTIEIYWSKDKKKKTSAN